MITNYPELKPVSEQLDRKSHTLCFAGGIAEQWCHREVIEVLPEIADCTYVLCGNGSGDYFAQLQQLPGWQYVDFQGQIPHTKVHDLLCSSGIGISLLKPSHNTGWNIGTMGNTKIFEEMMAGLPVICTDFSLWREFVDRYHCGICVQPDNLQQIAKAIRFLLDNPAEARRMGENGRRAVKEEFNWGVEEKKLLALYEDVLKA